MRDAPKIDVVIVDSDVRSQRVLMGFMNQDARLNIVRSIKSGKLLLHSLKRELSMDVLFMNPELMDGSSFDVLVRIPKEERPLIVMYNNRLDYAYYAYQIDVVDFLNMPFTRPEYDHCIQKLQREMKKEELYAAWLKQGLGEEE